MTDKIEFPLNTELSLRGGGVAVLYEFKDGNWFGRMKMGPAWGWEGAHWHADGDFDKEDPATTYDLVPPRRKAWVVWPPKDARPHGIEPQIFTCRRLAQARCDLWGFEGNYPVKPVEVEEP